MSLEERVDRRPTRRVELPGPSSMSGLLTLFVTVAVVASLYFGREIFVPIALAILLSFALAPPVRWLRRLRVPNLPAVLFVVTLAFALILAFVWVVSLQVADLAARLPSYQTNIERKIDSFMESPPGGSLFERSTRMLRDLGRKIEQVEEEQNEQAAQEDGVVAPEESEAVAVVVQEPEPTSREIIQTVVGPLISPLTTAGIVIVFVIFMLLKRDDLRDRMIRLVGSRDLPRTTQALNDAAGRVGRYLLMQLIVNTTYGIPIGIGLWLIGIPNPILWGMLCTVLRFVPYIGPIIAAFFPLVLAVAVDPGWCTLLWAGALFIVIELISNNFIEPLLYGSSTGLSPVAVIAAAVFWTWLWGPIGLLLSTPLTVCVMVLGQYVPQLGFLDVLLGSKPVLSPPEHLYQRLLVGDAIEATEHAEEYLRENSLVDFFDATLIPALVLADHDRDRGALGEDQLVRVAESTLALIENLADREEPAAAGDESGADTEVAAIVAERNAGERKLVLCAGARDELDEAAAAALAQLLERQDLEVRLPPFRLLQSARLREADAGNPAIILLSDMNSGSLAYPRVLIRRLRRRLPKATIILGIWAFPPEERSRRDPVEATRADHIVTSFREAMETVLDSLKEEASPEPRPLAVATSINGAMA